MKKIYAIIAIMLMFAGAYAQTSDKIALNNGKLSHQQLVPTFHHYHHGDEKSTQGFWIDIDSADSYDANGQGILYTHFAGFKGNGNYSWPADSVAYPFGNIFNYMIVAFDSLVDAYNSNGPTAYAYNTVTSVLLDSISAVLGQENNSGLADTLLVQVINVTGSTYLGSYPGSTILYSDTIVIPADTALSTLGGNNPSNDYTNYVQLNLGGGLPAGGLTIPGNMKFAVKLTYLGAKTDTFAYFTGTPYFNGTGSCSGFGMADTSFYYPNTFVYWPAQGSILPTTTGADIYYPCDNNNTDNYGIDGQDYFQDGTIEVFVTIDVSSGIQQNKALGIKLFQNMPNPFNNTTDIAYQLGNRANEVTLNVTDLAGRILTSVNEGGKDAGKYNITLDSKNLAAGVYFYTLTVDGTKLTNKMIITK